MKYMDYSALKKSLNRRLKAKANSQAQKWGDVDEAEFKEELNAQLLKVAEFQEKKIHEFTAKITDHDQEANSLFAKRHHDDENGHADGRDEEEMHHAHPDDSDDEADDEHFELQCQSLEAQLEDLMADVHELGKFTALNYTGFIKIVKKHDKRTGYSLRAEFMREYLNAHPFYRENYDALIVQLSRIYNLVRTRGNPVQGDSAAGGSQSAFVRQTTKYWVHPDNYVQLKLAILKHLPVLGPYDLMFKKDKAFEASDAAITSIYFDNEDLDLYLGRLEKTEGAEAVRLRWYGSMDTKTIFVERKTHREDWTGEKSVKARFPIKEELVNDYLSGKLIMDETFNALRGKKSDKEVDSMIKLAREVQASIRQKKLVPVVRTFYDRTAFQLPGDARVRISFDANLTMVREDNWDGVQRSGKNWRRMDIGIDHPFDQLDDSDKHLFPYGVLEVKLQTQAGQRPPAWVTELVESHLVEAVPKFSKFIHGCATLVSNRVDLLPFWMPQMDIDIRKPETKAGAAVIARPTTLATNTTSATASTSKSGSRRSSDLGVTETGPYHEPVSEDENEEDEDTQPTALAADEGHALGLPADSAQAAKQQREAKLQKEKEDGEDRRETQDRSGPVFAKLTPGNLERLLRSKYGGEEGDQEQSSTKDAQPIAEARAAGIEIDPVAAAGASMIRRPEFVSSYRATDGKLIAVPIRIEPKVYFANERTYLAWLEFATLLSAIGIGILNFAPQDDPVALAAGTAFTIVALLAIIYAGYTFLWRALAIRKRQAVQYYDRVGPSVLCGILVVAVIGNWISRQAEGAHYSLLLSV